MTVDVLIRAAVVEDSPALTAFNQAMALETEGRTLATAVIAAGVGGLLRQPQYGFYLVAEAAGSPVGALLVTFEWSDWCNGLLWWIQSVYVQPAWRRRGVYRRLHQRVKALAAANQARGLRLYVEQDNDIAQRTYRALGMTPTTYRLFEEMLE